MANPRPSLAPFVAPSPAPGSGTAIELLGLQSTHDVFVYPQGFAAVRGESVAQQTSRYLAFQDFRDVVDYVANCIEWAAQDCIDQAVAGTVPAWSPEQEARLVSLRDTKGGWATVQGSP